MASVTPLHALNLDSSQQQSFMRYYRSLPEKAATTVRIFDRVDYYSVHGEDAHVAALDVFKSAAVVKTMAVDQQRLDYLVLSKNNFEKFVRSLLLVKQYQVEVYTNRGGGRSNDWAVEYRGSPGNLTQFEDLLFADACEVVVSSIVMAVKLGKDQLVGMCCVDTDECKFHVCEFTDNEFFSQLEALLIQMSPRECLLKTNNNPEHASRLKAIFQRSNVLCTVQKNMDLCSDALTADLTRLLYFEEGQQQSSNCLPEMNLTTAMAALHAAVAYLDLLAHQANFNKFTTHILDTKRFVHMDSAAVKALNVLPKPGASASERRATSLLGLLDECRTAAGRRMLAQWLMQPLRDLHVLNDRLDVVELFVNDLALRHTLCNDHLRRIPDLLMLSKKLVRRKCKLQELYKVYQAIDKLPAMVAALRSAKHKTLQSQFVDPLTAYLQDMDKFQRLVEKTLNMDLVEKGEFWVNHTFDEQLEELYEKKLSLDEKIQMQLHAAARDLGFESGKNIKLDFTEQLGHFLRVTQKEEPALRKAKHYKVVGAVKGGVRFTCTALEDLNAEYMEMKQQYEEQQKAVLSEVQALAAEYGDTLKGMSYVAAQLDVLASLACVACAAPKQYVRPTLLPEGAGRMRLDQVRHPCLEQQERVSYTPNDIAFQQGHCTFHIVTGPNMGGKSTYIRSVGVAALLAHIGSFVPCDQADIPLLDSILARVGSEDCQAKGLSTFMLEMVETAGIIRTATQNSLVIIDELGRGTSTYEGCGIAWAIAEHIAKEVKAFAMFATHFHEITKLADDVPTVANKYVTALITGNTLTLLHQVKPGTCDQSFGIHVAKMAGFPDEFVEYATSIQNNLEDYRNMLMLRDYDTNKRQAILQEGDAIIAEALEKCKQLNHKRMSDEELETNLKRIKADIVLKDNPYLLTLLADN